MSEINYKKEFIIVASMVLGGLSIAIALCVGGLLWLTN